VYLIPTVLVVDNSDENIELVSDILKKNNYKIIVEKSGKKALETMRTETIDLVLLDIIMPDMNGFEIAGQIKSNANTDQIPIIFLSTSTNSADIQKGFSVGAQDYVTKPFQSMELLARVATHIELYFAKKQLEDNLSDNIMLLNQYKEVVDKSSIVSKTDNKGRITFVNDAFVKISGFEIEELLGKPHSIVRHVDMPKEAFKDMWETLQRKEIWKGEVKNLKKDGSYYVVQSTVMPILDATGEIAEFISVRHDITDLYHLQEEIEDTQKEVVFTMGSIGETRSKETGNHVKRVAEYSRILAQYLGLDRKQIDMLVQASPMHDIGKVGIPDNVLHKPGKLDDEEFFIMRTHAELGHKMLCHSKRPLLKLAATIAIEHHERWDGKGYPKYLKADEISIEGRITAIADVFDALGSDRVYKEAWEDEKILRFFKEEKGKQFDPKLTDIFFEHIDKFFKVREKFRDM
jgi:PAS domain S-box-containing protein